MLSLSENPLYWLLNEEISVHYAKPVIGEDTLID